MLDSFTDSSTVRLLPFEYFPRWFNGYYDQNSPLKKFLYASLFRTSQDVLRALPEVSYPTFSNNITEDRYLYILPGINTSTPIQSMSITSPSTSVANTSIQFVNSLGSMVYEDINPVWSSYNQAIALKNIDIVSYVIYASGNMLDFSSVFELDTPDPDSILIIENGLGDYAFYTIDDLVDNKLPIQSTNAWKVFYRSSTLRQSFLSGTSYISCGNQKIVPNISFLSNKWDDLGSTYGVARLDNETNIDYSKRLYSYKNTHTYQEAVGAMLNLSKTITWDTGSLLSLSGSGLTYVSAPQLNRYNYLIEDVVLASPSSFFVSSDNLGITSLFVDNKVYSGTYSISGNTVTLPSNLLDGLTLGRVQFQYKKNIYSTSYSSNYVNQLIPENLSRSFQTVVVTKNLQCLPYQKRVDKIYWNQPILISDGVAQFD